MTQCHIYAYRSGQAGIAQRVPQGAITVITGKRAELEAALSVNARHAYDGKTLLVPGIPEARSERRAAEALRDWRARLETSIRNRRQRPTKPQGLEASQ